MRFRYSSSFPFIHSFIHSCQTSYRYLLESQNTIYTTPNYEKTPPKSHIQIPSLQNLRPPERKTTHPSSPHNILRSQSQNRVALPLPLPSSLWQLSLYTYTTSIIVLHGHTGHYRDSFTNQPSSCFWLQDLLPSVFHNLESSKGKDVRVLSFQYGKEDEVRLGSEKIVEFLGQQIFALQTINQNKPILFIAHSFGGSLLQGLLASQKNEWLREVTAGILFFGVAKGSGWRNLVGALEGVKEEELSEEMRGVRREVEWLKESEEGFERKVGMRGWDVRWFREGNGQGGGVCSSFFCFSSSI